MGRSGQGSRCSRRDRCLCSVAEDGPFRRVDPSPGQQRSGSFGSRFGFSGGVTGGRSPRMAALRRPRRPTRVGGDDPAPPDRAPLLFLATARPAVFDRARRDRAPVAQRIERRPPEPKVAGSNPVGRATVGRATTTTSDRTGARPCAWAAGVSLADTDSLACGTGTASIAFADCARAGGPGCDNLAAERWEVRDGA